MAARRKRVGTKGQDRIRINLAVSPAVKERIVRLQEISEAETLTEVVRRALAGYERLLEIQKSGGRILLEDRDGAQTSLEIL